ncbi:MAG: hypothetical protein M1839_008541 [Geoglossum umbratile]|nr:MAG: hypothetical protein M1839_008541 [Geoglossum umbratile]
MAEPFGITTGAFGRHFGRDFQTNLLALNCTRLHLTRWGLAVDVYNDPKLGRPDANVTEILVARDTLRHILELFANTEKISKKYKLSAKPSRTSPQGQQYLRSELKELLEPITSLLDNLERLFPAPQLQTALAQQETAEIQDKQALELVQSVAQGVDGLLQTATKEALTGHQYLDVKGKAQPGGHRVFLHGHRLPNRNWLKIRL